MYNKNWALFFTLIGLMLLAVGLALLKWTELADGALRSLPYICIGVGCGSFGHGVGHLVGLRTFERHPELAKQQEIEQNDERNVAIMRRAKARSFDIMLPTFGALLIAFALMNVELVVVLLLVAAYLFVVFCNVFYQLKYQKQM